MIGAAHCHFFLVYIFSIVQFLIFCRCCCCCCCWSSFRLIGVSRFFFSFFIFYFFFRLSFVLMFYWQEENINLCSYTLLSSIGFLYKYPLNNIPFALPTVILVTLWEEQLLLSLHTNIHSQLVSLFRYFNHITHTHTAIATYAHSHQCPQVKFTTTTPCFLMELPLWMLTTISTKFPI